MIFFTVQYIQIPVDLLLQQTFTGADIGFYLRHVLKISKPRNHCEK